MWVPVAVWQLCELQYTCYLPKTLGPSMRCHLLHYCMICLLQIHSKLLCSTCTWHGISLSNCVPFFICSIFTVAVGYGDFYRCIPLNILHHTHHPFNGPFPGLPEWAGTRKVKPIWILLKQETVSGSGISWAICKSATCSRQITTPAPHHSVFYRPDALPAAQPTASKHWRHNILHQLM